MNPTPRNCCLLALGLACGFFAGCSTPTYTVQVDAISGPTGATTAMNSGGSYQIKEPAPQGETSELRLKEVADRIRTALSSKGMYEAPAGQKADIIVSIDYGMESPRIKFESVSSAVFTNKGDDSYTIRVPVYDASGGVSGSREIRVERLGHMEYLGQETVVEPEIVYEKYLKVSARENVETAEGRAPPEVWSVNVSAEDGSKDLRKYIPILASATADYIGTNTKAAVPVKIGENDEAVKFIKRGL